MAIRRVALIFDNQGRPETTGGYCLRALRGLVEVEHFLPGDLAPVPRRGFELYLQIDDGLDYRLPEDLHPCAWWAIDIHLNLTWCLAKARDFDLVFAAQRDGAEQLSKGGIGSAVWLPLACDPEVHRKHDVPKRFDVCFVGNVFPGPRADLLELLRRRWPNNYVGRCYFDEMAQTYSGSRTVFNRSVRNDVNMRVFEAVACGSLLLTNDLRDNGQDEFFRDGVELATYGDAEELLDKMAFYVAREEVREKIAAAGRQKAIGQHTYRQRMESLLALAEKGLAPARTSVPVTAPAGGMAQPPDDAKSPDGWWDPSYFEFDRPELLALIPASARKVLEIGCGTGRLGASLKARQPAEVVGVERFVPAAQAARSRLDQVLVGDVEEMEFPFTPATLDAIVCGDVMEHLREPGRLLRQAASWLRPDGCLIASIPNVRHHSVVRGLLEGNWTYEPAGLLDQDHLRFFTRRGIEQLFARTGFQIRQMQVVPGPGYEEWNRNGRSGDVKVGRLHIGGLAPQEAEEFYVYQYLVVAAPVPLSKVSVPPASGAAGDGRWTRTGRAGEVGFAIRGPMDGAILEEVWDRDVYGVRLVAEPPRTVVDIGAHIGAFTVMAAEAWPGARVVACEADPQNFRLLRKNVGGRMNVEAVPLAVVGSVVTEVEFYATADMVGGNSGCGSCVRLEPGTVKTRVPALSVVRLWQGKGLSPCDLLKLDCEGSEIGLLRALADAGLLAQVRFIVGEWHSLDEAPLSKEHVKGELATILGPTHEVVFSPDGPRKEGYFRARSLRLG